VRARFHPCAGGSVPSTYPQNPAILSMVQ